MYTLDIATNVTFLFWSHCNLIGKCNFKLEIGFVLLATTVFLCQTELGRMPGVTSRPTPGVRLSMISNTGRLPDKTRQDYWLWHLWLKCSAGQAGCFAVASGLRSQDIARWKFTSSAKSYHGTAVIYLPWDQTKLYSPSVKLCLCLLLFKQCQKSCSAQWSPSHKSKLCEQSLHL